jgi:pantothenate kinase
MPTELKMKTTEELAAHIADLSGDRIIVAIAGPPAAGKSTISADLRDRLANAAVLQADGFHYDNVLLEKLGRRHRKGAPDTFDCAGLGTVLDRIRDREDNIVVPVFDRGLDVSRGCADMIGRHVRLVVVEGNYLASSEQPWSELRPKFDLVVFLGVPLPELQRRLERRWLDLGWPKDRATSWIEGNDLPNIRFTEDTKTGVDIVLQSAG